MVRRIAIVGSSGSGKSTLAMRLGGDLELPVTHLDQLFWTPGWIEQDKAVWRASVDAVSAREAWIIEGNGSRVSGLRFQRAEVILWLETSRWICLARVIRRALFTYGRVRPDMAPGCPERIDLAFWRYVWRWDRDTRPKLEAVISAAGAEAKVVRLRSARQVEAWMANSGAA
jgi:adenylate kinase family enzyme